ncbi:MAG: hypothetical protein KC445_03680 [Anaerolineales bacterium]|nr:hypothetical protein [Anaerolineales bacterium]
MSFEWQTDEEYEWEQTSPEPEPPRRRRRWPWWLLLGVVLVGTAVFLIYRQLNQRIDVATDEIEADLTASYEVWQRAVQNRDENLFNSLLSGRDPEWLVAQRELLHSGMVFNRSGFGLEWVPGVGETAVLSQTFSLDFTSAELTTLQNYSLAIGNGLTQTVQLARTDVYRLGEDRWLYAPPEPEFWGEMQTVDGQLLSVTYPARDEAIVQRLAADLEAKLVQLCATSGYDCPPDMQLQITFSPEPQSLNMPVETAFGSFWMIETPIVLPTPTLIGLPQDETGYGAIFSGYASSVLVATIMDLIGWESGVNPVMYLVLLERQLYELGVSRWPLMETAVLLPDGYVSPSYKTFEDSLFWNASFPTISLGFEHNPTTYILVDFLVNEFHLSTGEMAQALVASNEERFIDWLQTLAGLTWTEAVFFDAFRSYVARWQASPRVLPEPEDGLVLLCRDPLWARQGLYYFDPSLEEPSLLTAIPYEEQLHFIGLPDGAGVAMVVRESPTSQPETYLLLNGTERVDVDWSAVEGVTSRPPFAVPTNVVGNGRYLLWTVTQDYANGNFFALTDLAACQSGLGCAATPVGGYPTWSPSGEQLISQSVIRPWWTEGTENGMMLLREAPTAPAINSPGFGASVFWLDESEFGYLSEFQNGLQQLVVTDVALSRPETLLTSLSLPDLLPNTDLPNSLTLEFAQPLPGNPQIIFILASDVTRNKYLFLFDRSIQTIIRYLPLTELPGSSLLGYRFAPNGRTLLIAFAQQEQTSLVLLGVDPSSPSLRTIRLEGSTALPRHFYANWSAAGDWLVLPENGYLRLWYDGTDERLLNFEGLACTNAAWVDRMGMVNGE